MRFGDGLRAEDGIGAGDELPRLPRRGDKGGAVSRPHQREEGGGMVPSAGRVIPVYLCLSPKEKCFVLRINV